MIEPTSRALGTSLVFARLGGLATTPPSEQQLVERLQAAARDVGCCTPDVVTALYVGLKIHLRVCVCGPARAQTMALFDAIVTTLVGPESDQALHLRGPIGSDQMAQRFAALRLSDFVSAVLEPAAQGKAWFLLIDTPGDPTAMLEWVEREIGATLQAAGRARRALPANLFVLVAAGEPPPLHENPPCCILLAAPTWGEPVKQPTPQSVPPVGYQRQLLDWQLTSAAYRHRLHYGGTHSFVATSVRERLLVRWLAASIDQQGHGLWEPLDRAANRRKAVAFLHASGLSS